MSKYLISPRQTNISGYPDIHYSPKSVIKYNYYGYQNAMPTLETRCPSLSASLLAEGFLSPQPNVAVLASPSPEHLVGVDCRGLELDVQLVGTVGSSNVLCSVDTVDTETRRAGLVSTHW